MGETVDLSSFVRLCTNNQAEMDFALEGVSCGGCIARIEGGLRKLPGVIDARVNFSNRRAHVVWTNGTIAPAAIVEEVERLGYGVHPFVAQRIEDDETKEASRLMRCLAVAGFAAMNIMLLSVSVWSGNVSDITPEIRDLFHWISALIAIPAVAYAGQPFFRSAWNALRVRAVNMDVPISLGVILAVGMSIVETINHAEHAYFDSAAMLLFFLLCGRYLDRAMRRRTRAVAGNLAALRAPTAHRLEADGSMIEVPANTLRAGDKVLVRPGDRVAADGVVIGGTSTIDESMVTGETAHRAVHDGETVYAGSLNFTGNLTLRITAVGESTLLDEIERLLDRAAQSKSRTVQLADRAARKYAPLVHTAAALTLAGWLISGASVHDAIIVAIAVLIITCPCALALAVPAVQVVAAGRLFRKGIILNTGDAIERLAEVDTVAFDKTGTLTLPEATVTNAGTVSPSLLDVASRLALSSRHPLAVALARKAHNRQPFEDAIETPGAGVSARIDGKAAKLGSPAFCNLAGLAGQFGAQLTGSLIAFRHGDEQAVFVIQQTLRPDAVAVIRAIQANRIEVCILSGDRAEAVSPIATVLGITEWHAGLVPGRKVEILQALKTNGKRVLMVGDGINDAPSLAEAHVSISPVTGAEISQAHADAVFIGTRFAPVLEAITVSRAARRLMIQNLWLAVVYNVIAVPIAMAGLVTPLIAALAMSGSSLLVTANALRLGLVKATPDAVSAPTHAPREHPALEAAL